MSLSSWFLPLCVAGCLLPVVGGAAEATVPTPPAAPVATVPRLGIGDPAPALAVGRWIKGEPVVAFDRDHAYLLEFWATWCGPCQAAIPHVNEIHQTFAGKGLVVIGQDVFEADQAGAVAFVAAKGDGMSYRVALDDVTTNKDGVMAATWLNATGQDGIPASILVGKDGSIAWIGHPMELTDRIIQGVLAGTYDLAQAKRDLGFRQTLAACDEAIAEKNWTKATALRDELNASAASPEERRQIAQLTFLLQIQQGDLTAACANAEAMAAGATDPDLCNELAWAILTAKKPTADHVAVGHRLAQRASLATQGKNAAIQDTLARALFLSGKRAEAIAVEQAAVDLEPEDASKEPYRQALEAYRAGKLPSQGE